MSRGHPHRARVHSATALNILQKDGPERSTKPQQEFIGDMPSIISQIGIKHQCERLLCGERRLENAADMVLRPDYYLFIVGDAALKDLKRFRTAILASVELSDKKS